jgi:hypothetical protein
MEFPFAGDQARRLFFTFFLAAGGPLLELSLALDEFFVLGGELAADRFQFLLLIGQFGVGLPVLVGQLRADPPQRADERRRRRGAGKLHPEFLGGQADFQRLAVQSRQLAAKSLQRGAALVHVIGSPLHGLALLGEVGRRLLKQNSLPLHVGGGALQFS